MEMPQILKGESITRLVQGAIAGAVATAVVGFTWGGWTLASTAEKMASERVNTALVTAYTPVCVQNYRNNATEEQRTAFKDARSWNRDDVIEKAGFATTPGSDAPNAQIADECAKELAKIDAAKATTTQ